jgi:hypothetical protein
MEARGKLAGALVLLAAAVSCAPPAEDGEHGETVEPEVPLDLTVDHVDVAHGSMRLRATMADGSPELSIVLGRRCDEDEVGRGAAANETVGRGMATRVSLVWAFDDNDVAEALRCDLVVRAHAWTDQGRVVETTDLAFVPDVTPISVPAPDEGASDEGAARPELTAIEHDPKALALTFRSLTPRATLTVGDSRIERTRSETEQEAGETDEVVDDDTTATFVVPYEAFARALLDDRPLRVDATAFEPMVAVATVASGATALERDSPGDGTVTEEPNAVEESNEIEEPNAIEGLRGPEESNAIEELEAPTASDEMQSP